MIREIFLPDRYDGYYLFSRKIVGFDIGKMSVNATLVRAQGNQRTITDVIEEKIEFNKQHNNHDRIVACLKTVVERIGSFDEARTAISSAEVVFRNLTIPFTTYEKIHQVIAFEVEPLLPFTLDKAIIDFVITHVDNAKQMAQVMVAAVPKQHIAEHLSLFEAAGVDPDMVTIDLFALVGLYNLIPFYASLTGNVALVAIGVQSTRIAFIHNGVLTFVRSLPQGVMTLAKTIGTGLQINPSQAYDHLVRYGAQESDWPEYTKQTQQTLKVFWQNVHFTLTSFVNQVDPNGIIAEQLLLGAGAEIKAFPAFITKEFSTPCALFNPMLLAENQAITIKKNVSISSFSIMSVGIALPNAWSKTFNLRKQEFSPAREMVLLKQLVAAGIMILFILLLIIGFVFWQTRKLSKELYDSEQEVLTVLQQHFPRLPSDIETVDEALEKAREIVKKDEEKWGVFSAEKRLSFLHYLLELTRRIDKAKLGFVPRQIVIADNTLTLSARVKSTDELKLLEHALRESKLFGAIPGQDDPNFVMKIQLKQLGAK